MVSHMYAVRKRMCKSWEDKTQKVFKATLRSAYDPKYNAI